MLIVFDTLRDNISKFKPKVTKQVISTYVHFVQGAMYSAP